MQAVGAMLDPDRLADSERVDDDQAQLRLVLLDPSPHLVERGRQLQQVALVVLGGCACRAQPHQLGVE